MYALLALAVILFIFILARRQAGRARPDLRSIRRERPSPFSAIWNDRIAAVLADKSLDARESAKRRFTEELAIASASAKAIREEIAQESVRRRLKATSGAGDR
jgi:hypothetical protein